MRPVFVTLAVIAVIWLGALAGYESIKHARITADKVCAYLASVDFADLTGADRAAALDKLAALLNALSYEERQKLELNHALAPWFRQMTEDEKGKFLEATMPTGIKQALNAFGSLPAEKQQHLVNNAIKNLEASRKKLAAGGKLAPAGTNNAALSPELQQKMMKIGLQSFYSQSSAETKAAMAPLLEELQSSMQSGQMLHGPQ